MNWDFILIRDFSVQFAHPLQSKRIPNGWIAENLIVVQEIVHSFKRKSKGIGQAGVKLYRHAKGLYKVEWNFILTVLKCFGFGEKFITLIRQCITTVSFTLLLNGS